MTKVAYKKVKRTARKARRNPTLLTLVNPGKKGGNKVARGKKKAAPKKRKTTKKKAAAKKATPTKAMKKATAASTKKIKKAADSAAKKISKAGDSAAKKIKKAAKSASKPKKPRAYGVGEYPRKSYRPGPALRKSRSLTYEARVGKKKTKRSKKRSLTTVTRRLPDPGWYFVAGRDRDGDGEPDTAGYWRYQKNSGGPMRRRKRRKAAPKRRYRANKRRAPKRGAKGRFVKRNPRKRKTAKRRTVKRRSYKKNRRKPARRKTARKRSYKKNRRKPARRKATRRRKSYRKNARRKPIRRRRRRMKKNAALKPILMKAGVGFLGFLGGRVLANQLASQPMIPAAVRPYASVLGPVAMTGLAYWALGQKGPKALKKMRKYQMPLMIGAGVAALDALFTQFAPASLQALVGGGAAPALAGWQGTSSYWGDSGSSGAHGMLPGRGYPVRAGMNEYVREPMGEYVREGMGEYVMTDEDGVPMGDLYNLDAGVIDDGLYGDPGDDALDIEVLD